MKCVILAAGRGERMRPLTDKTPKPLLKVKGKCLVDHVLESLPKEINEVIIVIDYLGEQIKEHIGKEYKGKKVIYVIGSDKGNGYSFMNTRYHLQSERFLVIYGDEIPNSENVKKCLSEDLSMLLFKSKGKWIKDGVMVLNTDIFRYTPEVIGDENFSSMAEVFNIYHFVTKIKAKNFIGEINTPEDLERANNG